MAVGTLHRPVSRWCPEALPLFSLELFAVHLWMLQPYCTASLSRGADAGEGTDYGTYGQHPEMLIGIFLGNVSLNVNQNLEFGRETMTGDPMMLATDEEK